MQNRIISILRPHHWSKNMIIILGFFLALVALDFELEIASLIKLFLITLSFCIISSGNYMLNDLVDKEFDKFHPLKKKRAIAKESVSTKMAFILFIVFWATGLSISFFYLGNIFLIFNILFILFAVLYNVNPFRFKAIPILDVLTESLNSPLRLYAGWFVLVNRPMDVWILLFIYFYTALLMNSKRLAELQYITEKVAKKYREVFKYYTKQRLSFLFYIYYIFSVLSLILLSFRYNILFLIPTCFMMVQLYWYYQLALTGSLDVQKTEYIYRNRPFTLFSLLILCLSMLVLIH